MTVISGRIPRSLYSMYRISLTIIVAALFVVVAALLWVNRPRRVIVEAPLPAAFPDQGFSHAELERLLGEYVSLRGRVDYARWHETRESVEQLEAYLAAVSRFSPDNAPQRFPDRNAELAYWLYGYNACVIKAVLDNWPLSSVTDVKAPVEAIRGMGFFHQLRFSFGGEYLSLLAVENRKIRARYRDARIHFVLNCASESCPVVRSELPNGDTLEDLMTTAAVEFVNDSDNVTVDHDSRTVYLNAIFKWYEKDFINDLRARGRPTKRGLIDYVALHANGDLADKLLRADGYKVEFRDYDWSLNAAR